VFRSRDHQLSHSEISASSLRLDAPVITAFPAVPAIRRSVLWPVAAALVVAAAGAAIGTGHQPLLVVGMIAGLEFLLLAILAPVPALALFLLLTFISQLSVVGPGLSLAKGAGGALVLAWVYRQVSGRIGSSALVDARRFAMFAAPFLVWSVGSALWASDSHVALSSAARIAQGPLLVIVIVALVETRVALRLICYTFVGGATLSAVVGLAGVTKPDTGTAAATGRLTGGIGDPNYLAAVLVPAIALALFMFLGTKGWFPRAALLIASSVCLSALFLTQSRGGIVALGVTVVAAVIFAGPARRNVLAATSVVGAIASVYLLLIAPPHALNRLTVFHAGGGTGRTDLWTVAANAFESHPFEGIGLGNFTVVEPTYAVSTDQPLPRADLVVTQRQPVHNTYLHIAAELGIVGALLLAGVLVAVLAAVRSGVRSVAARRDAWLGLTGRGLFVGCLGMLSAFTFLTAQYDKQLWLTLGLLLAFARVSRQASESILQSE
jgi:O-antigen ligase